MKKLKIGIIGLGVGEKHLEAYHSHPDTEVVALCDFSKLKERMAKEKYPDISFYKDAFEILEMPDIDVVSIASYDNYHFDQVCKAIKKKKNVFVEKPLCFSEKEGIIIKRLLTNNPGVKISSNLVLRTVPLFKKMKQMISSGEIGKIFYMEGDYNSGRLFKVTDGWRGDIDNYSLVFGGMIHLVDLLIWFLGEEVVEVFAYGNSISSKGSKFRYEDFVVSILKFESGIIAKTSASLGCIYPHSHPVTIYGTSATLIHNPDCSKIIKKNKGILNSNSISQEYPGNDKDEIIRSFVDSILYNKQSIVSQDDVFNTMSVCFAIHKSLSESIPINVTV